MAKTKKGTRNITRKSVSRPEAVRASDSVTDSVTGFPVYMSVVDEAAKALIASASMGILSVRLVDSLRMEAKLGSRGLERVIQRAARKISNHLEKRMAKPWQLAINGCGGDLLLAFVGPAKGETQINEESLFRLKEELQEIGADDLGLAVNYALCYPQPGVDPRRIIYQGVERVMGIAHGDDLPEFERQNQAIKRIIYQSHIRTVFQPIVSLETEKIFGYEALTRGPAETEYESPDFLFALSRRSGLLLEMDLLCRNVAVSSAVSVPAGAKLFVNVLAHTLSHHRFLEPRFFRLLDEAGIEPSRVAFEVSEKFPVGDYTEFRRNAAELRSHGFTLAVDDAGMGYSNLRTLFELNPEYVKMDHSLVRNVHREPVHERVLTILDQISRELGAVVVAEGVETKEELERLKALGIPYGQGYYFSKPMLLGQAAAV